MRNCKPILKDGWFFPVLRCINIRNHSFRLRQAHAKALTMTLFFLNGTYKVVTTVCFSFTAAEITMTPLFLWNLCMCLRVRCWQDGGRHILYGVSVWTWCVIKLGLGEKTWLNVYIMSQPQASCQDLPEQVSQTVIPSLHITPSAWSFIRFNLSGSLQEFPFIWRVSVFPSLVHSPFCPYIFSFLKLFWFINCDSGHAGSSLNVAIHVQILSSSLDCISLIRISLLFVTLRLFPMKFKLTSNLENNARAHTHT